MGIVFVVLALFLVTAITNDSIKYILQKNESEMASTEKVEFEDLSQDKRNLIDRFSGIVNGSAFKDIGENFKASFTNFSLYAEVLKNFSMFYWIGTLLLLLFMKTDKEYKGREHGSADWATGGEEYEVLDRKEGFVLAKDHYLPVIPTPPTGKNGNILVIGGSRKW